MPRRHIGPVGCCKLHSSAANALVNSVPEIRYCGTSAFGDFDVPYAWRVMEMQRYSI